MDASDYVTGEVLSIEYEDRKWRLVVFLSKLANLIYLLLSLSLS